MGFHMTSQYRPSPPPESLAIPALDYKPAEVTGREDG